MRDAFQNGHSSPQVPPTPGAIGWGLRSNAQQGEDCLVLNVFTGVATSENAGRRRPVMVWIHGGGYAYGSGSSLGYDGTNLARTGDVVVVCINHRLNIVGHLYLGGVGGKVRGFRKRGPARHRRIAGMGARQHRAASAAMPAT